MVFVALEPQRCVLNLPKMTVSVPSFNLRRLQKVVLFTSITLADSVELTFKLTVCCFDLTLHDDNVQRVKHNISDKFHRKLPILC